MDGVSEKPHPLHRIFFPPASVEEDQTKLAHFSKNFLPILFSLYATPTSDEAAPTAKEESEKKSYLMDCINAYLSITGTGRGK